MEELIFLGTGAAMTYRCFTTAIVLRDHKRALLMDTGGGNGVLTQLDRAGIPFDAITDVFITHTHTDHILGAPWLMRMSGHSYARNADWPPLTFYGAPEVLDTLQAIVTPILPTSIVNLFGGHIRFVPVSDGETHLLHDRPVTFFDIGASKVRQFGLYTPLSDGSGLTFLGDEPLRDAGLPYARKSRHLIHEAFCAADEPTRFDPHTIGHSTVADAAQNAASAGCDHLILFHSAADDDGRKARYLADAAHYFKGRIDAPDDLDVVPLTLKETL